MLSIIIVIIYIICVILICKELDKIFDNESTYTIDNTKVKEDIKNIVQEINKEN